MKRYLNYILIKINKSLSIGSRPLSGRNFLGTICVHHKSGGSKKRLYSIDFYRRINNYGYIIKIIKNNKFTGLIGGIIYENGLFAYILLTETLMRGSKIYSGSFNNINNIGMSIPLKYIKLFTIINNLELFPFSKGILIRSAGCSGLVIKKEFNKVYIKLKSCWNLILSKYCLATIGLVSNPKHKFNNLLKAGVSRNLGIRPTVRGVAMNPHDHPHGGGEGKKSPPAGQVSPWAWLTKGTPSLKKKWQKKKKKLYKTL